MKLSMKNALMKRNRTLKKKKHSWQVIGLTMFELTPIKPAGNLNTCQWGEEPTCLFSQQTPSTQPSK